MSKLNNRCRIVYHAIFFKIVRMSRLNTELVAAAVVRALGLGDRLGASGRLGLSDGRGGDGAGLRGRRAGLGDSAGLGDNLRRGSDGAGLGLRLGDGRARLGDGAGGGDRRELLGLRDGLGAVGGRNLGDGASLGLGNGRVVLSLGDGLGAGGGLGAVDGDGLGLEAGGGAPFGLGAGLRLGLGAPFGAGDGDGGRAVVLVSREGESLTEEEGSGDDGSEGLHFDYVEARVELDSP
jgi:hypothetical protein